MKSSQFSSKEKKFEINRVERTHRTWLFKAAWNIIYIYELYIYELQI